MHPTFFHPNPQFFPRLFLGFAAILLSLQAVSAGNYPKDAVQQKKRLLATAAARAVAQQRKTHNPPIDLKCTVKGVGNVRVEESTAWDIDGDGKCYKVTVANISNTQRDKGVKDRIEVRFPESVDFLAKSTGLSFWIKTTDKLSPNLRFGVYFKTPVVADPIVFNDIPVRQKFGDNPHEVYIDWGHAFDNSCGVMKTPPQNAWKKITGFDLPLVNRELPIGSRRRLAPISGVFYIDGIKLKDIYEGSFDSSRFANGQMNTGRNLTAQGRTQQVTRLCAGYGGKAGQEAAIRAMDMMLRLQSWDGSWPELRTRLQGEYTHGMIVADLAYALQYLRKANYPALKEKVKIRHFEGTRDDLYEQMIYRGAMSRAPGPISKWRDSYCSGEGALTGGCNRPMIYIFSQYVAAQMVKDPKRKAALMKEYNTNMDELATYQGKTAGGWPIFGEGNAFRGKGLHFDLGYTMDHVLIMAYAHRVTGDKRWAEAIRKFDTVIKTLVGDGLHFEGGFSERKGGKLGGKHKIKGYPDMVYQEAVAVGAPYTAQWAYNCSEDLWSGFPKGHWAYFRSARGYGLGAFLTWGDYDLQQNPAPENPGLTFPRQWDIFSVDWFDKSDPNKPARKALATIQPGGKSSTEFKWEVGQYPVAKGLPLAINPEGGAVTIDVLEHQDPPTHPIARFKPVVGVEGQSKPVSINKDAFSLKISKPTTVTMLVGRCVTRFLATPQEGKTVTLKCKFLQKP